MNNIKEVAKQAGVSTATVSRAFNTPELISAPTYKRVLDTAKQLDYCPLRSRQNAHPAELINSKKSFIGFQFFGSSPEDLLQANTFYASLLAGAQVAAAERSLHLLVHTTNQHQLAQQLPKMIREKTIAGMLLVGTADPRVLAQFSECVPQIVLVNYRELICRHDCIISDGRGGAMVATKHLFDLGHQRLAFLCVDASTSRTENSFPGANASASSFQDRLCGFVCAHVEAGRVPDPCLIVTASSENTILSALRDLLALPNRPTALLVANDHQALVVMKACQTLGVSIPNDLSLIGFDDVEFSSHTWPPLTTVHVPKEQIGRRAVSHLQERLRASEASLEAMLPVIVTVPVSLTVRQSCRAVA